jgi:hypothetical protein
VLRLKGTSPADAALNIVSPPEGANSVAPSNVTFPAITFSPVPVGTSNCDPRKLTGAGAALENPNAFTAPAVSISSPPRLALNLPPPASFM